MSCGRCGIKLDNPQATAEVCWYCNEWLCTDCWDRVGHCGHPEAEAANERARKVPQPTEPLQNRNSGWSGIRTEQCWYCHNEASI